MIADLQERIVYVDRREKEEGEGVRKVEGGEEKKVKR